jgi:hypothetical protein
LWDSPLEIPPYLDFRVGIRKVWEGRIWRGALEAGGAPTLIPPITFVGALGATGYASAHGVAELGPFELFASVEAAGGGYWGFVPEIGWLHGAYSLQAIAGFGAHAWWIHVTPLAGVWAHEDAVKGGCGACVEPSTFVFGRALRARFVGLRVSVDLPK